LLDSLLQETSILFENFGNTLLFDVVPKTGDQKLEQLGINRLNSFDLAGKWKSKERYAL